MHEKVYAKSRRGEEEKANWGGVYPGAYTVLMRLCLGWRKISLYYSLYLNALNIPSYFLNNGRHYYSAVQSEHTIGAHKEGHPEDYEKGDV